jgi:hypothetical protein
VKPAGPERLAARTSSRTRPGNVAAIMSVRSRAPSPRSRSTPARRKKGHRPTRTESIRATIP